MAYQNDEIQKSIQESNANKGMIILMAINSGYHVQYDEHKMAVNGQVKNDRLLRFYRRANDGSLLSLEVIMNPEALLTREQAAIKETQIQKALGIEKKSYDPLLIREVQETYMEKLPKKYRAEALAIWKNGVDTLNAVKAADDKYIDIVLDILESSRNQGMINNMDFEKVIEQ